MGRLGVREKLGLKLGFMLGGQNIKIDDDNYIEADWIRYKDIYIQILKGDHGYSVAWQRTIPDHYKIRDMLTAQSTNPRTPRKDTE